MHQVFLFLGGEISLLFDKEIGRFLEFFFCFYSIILINYAKFSKKTIATFFI